MSIKRRTLSAERSFQIKTNAGYKRREQDTEGRGGKLHVLVHTCLAHGTALLQVCPCWSRYGTVWDGLVGPPPSCLEASLPFAFGT